MDAQLPTKTGNITFLNKTWQRSLLITNVVQQDQKRSAEPITACDIHSIFDDRSQHTGIDLPNRFKKIPNYSPIQLTFRCMFPLKM